MTTKIIPKFYCQVEKGILDIDNKVGYQQWLNQLSGECEITIKKRKRLRSLNQNARYWVYLQLICEETGNNVDIMHELFKQKFIEPERISMFGLVAEKYKTTTELSTIEFMDYMKNIENLTEIILPDFDKVGS
ncbi:MAG TPA: hypothetical protein VI795_02360 [Patescibacteria group bacterium]|nr:hypothetical protein [Patescibacteria group bacterium]